MYSNMFSANSECFTSLFQLEFLFISFSSLISIARTSKIILNYTGEGGHPCFIPDLRENVFSFSLLSVMLVLVLSYMAFIRLR